LLPDGVIIWVHDQQQIHSVFVPVLLSDFQRTAENFIAECSRPDSNLPLLRSDAQTLYSWLIEPVHRWLPSTGHIIVEPHGTLNVLPFEALMDPSETYLGAQYAITMSPGLIAQEHATIKPAIGPADRALIVAAPADSRGSLEPPPGALAEANDVAQQFSQPTVVTGSKARSATIEKEIARSSVFHFAGHAMLGRSGAAMLLADGNLSITGNRKPPARTAGRNLSGLKLAVFSACGTAKPSEAAQSGSLVTEFLHAGAPNVVASRWNVDSMATTEFMIQFYKSVLAGHAVADALQTTARDFRKTSGWTHPYYWAAFSTFGNG
jgi:CHAT domain-containing protein